MIKFITAVLAYSLALLFAVSCALFFSTLAFMLNGSWMAIVTVMLGATLGAGGFIAISNIFR